MNLLIQVTLSNRQGPTEIDVKQMNLLYKCSGGGGGAGGAGGGGGGGGGDSSKRLLSCRIKLYTLTKKEIRGHCTR